MLRKTALLSMLLLCACEPYSSPAPNIVAIEPEEVVSGESATITLELDAPLPVKVDYGNRTATVLPPTVLIGGQRVAVTAMTEEGTLQATVPADLVAGPQEVRLELEDGHTSVQAQGLTVLPPPPEMQPVMVVGNPGDPLPEPGSGTPDPAGGSRPLLVTGLRIDPIPDQVRGVPFVITLRAEGPEAEAFSGQVQISTNKGHVTPNASNAFDRGVRQERISIDKQGGQVVLTVRVGKDIAIQSNPFKVSVQ
ncbi:hypothetical protein [Archangium sp.]|uniref:hypothetical protein n=1 Tax=Archangium sp. TaxID=1872627 RepID=UPI003899D125